MTNPSSTNCALANEWLSAKNPGMQRIKTAIVGASGYTGSELLRLLLQHPHVDLCAVTSRQEAGKAICALFPRYRSLPGADLAFMEPDADAIAATGAQVAFLALPHGVAAEIATALLARGLKVIDLSADFRIHDPAIYQEFYQHPHPAPELLKTSVYGLAEIYETEIAAASLIAAPGCYPTSILLPLIPLLRAHLIDPHSIIANSLSGVSGAGKKADTAYLFCECNESLRAYGLPKHRHLAEIEQELSVAAGETVRLTFIPHLVPVNTGIHSSITASIRPGVTLDQVGSALHAAYDGKPFVRLLGAGVCADTKNVTRTNFIDIGWHLDARTNRLILTSAEDNVIKGAGGQAVQSFNLIFGLDEKAGLQSV
jgi:N-acetyl-gamma-glutamyl-phosphate reductase